MDISLVAIFYGIVGAIGWGLSNFFAAKSTRTDSAVVTVFNSQLLLFILMSIVALFIHQPVQLSLEILLFLAINYLLFTIGLLVSYKSFAIGPISITSPIAGSYAIVTVGISVLVFGEILKINQWLGVLLLFIGLAIASYDKGAKPEYFKSSGIFLAFIALVLIGSGIAGFVYAIKEIGWVMAVLLGYFFPTFWTGLYLLYRNKFTYPRLSINIVLLTIFQLAGTLAVSIGVERTISALVVPVSSVSPIVTSILGLLFFKEKIRSYKLFGIVLIAVSLVLISLA